MFVCQLQHTRDRIRNMAGSFKRRREENGQRQSLPWKAIIGTVRRDGQRSAEGLLGT